MYVTSSLFELDEYGGDGFERVGATGMEVLEEFAGAEVGRGLCLLVCLECVAGVLGAFLDALVEFEDLAFEA